ncbi:hypothetical protein J5N97_030307 [Dioscorea zingiberensis]|uniref:Uncharacterized protein n=1 Tax=Dioscorea zingiberensis TaxID=325984 RepID=A0A9D5H445_9LILI|nr:hypothetical protein J5N97_030307 [Dioscorea zingiberensis]
MSGFEWSHKELGNIHTRLENEKVGCIVTSVLSNENHDFLRMVINTVGNIGGREFAKSLVPDVQRLLLYYGVDESYKLSNIPTSGDPMYGHIEVVYFMEGLSNCLIDIAGNYCLWSTSCLPDLQPTL